jgi:hypothetical protein
MIIFDLACADEHRFEGWFRSADDFSAQQARGLVSCPQCASVDIRRVPSAIHVGGGVSGEASQTTAPAAPRDPVTEAGTPTAPLAVLKTIVERVLANSENVGSAFPEEARRIHYHESPARPIHGEASTEDCEALREEGIDIVSLPFPKPGDLN